MGKGWGVLVAVSIVSIFAGAFVCEVLKKTVIAKRAAGKVSEGFQSAKTAFKEGYRSASQPSHTSA